MKSYVAKIKHEESNNLSVCFYIEQDKIMGIGDKMYALNELAYMNGYNWEAFFNYYLNKNYPQVLSGMGSDPEAGMYVAYYTFTPENDSKANKLIEIIEDLIENEAKLLAIIENEGENIEWD